MINWEDISAGIGDAWEDVKNVGVPAIQSSLEKWGMDVLKEQNQKTEQKLSENLKTVLERPVQEGSFGSYLQNELKGPVLQNYGPMILVGLGGVLLLGYYLK